MPTDFPRLLTQEEFDAGTADWQTLVDGTDADALQAAFGLPAALLPYGVLSGPDAVELVADPNTTTVKTRFVLLPIEGGGAAFAVAVFGTDEAGETTTPYYAAAFAAANLVPLNGIIPDAVAQEWLDAWQDLAADPDGLTQALFGTADGPLRGYNYPASDFRGPLAPLEPGDAAIVELRVYYGLHPAEATDFGLVMALGSATADPLPSRLTVVFYDNGESYPPHN